MRYSSIFLLPLAPTLVTSQGSQKQDAPIQSGPTTNQDRVVNYPYCYEALNRHDSNLNNKITKSEYLGFCQDFGANTECLADLQELPIELQAVWNEISCECVQRGGAADCCVGSNAHIPINGVLPTDTTTISQQQFLRQACLRTDQAIIAFCGPPPIPPVIGPPGGLVLAAPAAALPEEAQWGIIAAAIILLLCCCRRRWFFFPGKKEDDSSSESSSVDAGNETIQITDTEVPVPDAGMDEEDATAQKMKAQTTEEANLGGTTTFTRTVQEPEYEDDEEFRRTKYEQYDQPVPLMAPFNLNHIEQPPPPPDEEEPYHLPHYTPDGGVVQHEREGNWRYDADGGYVPETRPEKKKLDWQLPKYQRAEKKEPEVVDNRKKRTLDAYVGADIFNVLDGETSDSKAGGDGMYDWVIRETLNALDDNALHLDESTDEE